MEKHFTFTDDQFERLFENKTLEPDVFTHEAHIRLAWIHITKYGPEQACDNVVTQLLAYVKMLGAEDKFNHTLTVASMKMIDHFMSKSSSVDFKGFIGEFPQLKTNFKGLVIQHYSFDIFNSAEARQGYLEPDLLPFD